jgi:hypothetical protein
MRSTLWFQPLVFNDVDLLLNGELTAGITAYILDRFSVFDMLILRLLCFSLKVAEVSLSESGHLVPYGLKPYRFAPFPNLPQMGHDVEFGLTSSRSETNDEKGYRKGQHQGTGN